MRLRFFPLLLLLALSTNLLACEEKYEFQVGPFFSTSSVFRFWSGFTKELSLQTGCEVSVVTSSSFEQYLNSILDQEHDLYIAPDHYTKAFLKLGYTPTLRTEKDAHILLVSRRDLTNKDLSALVGDDILVPGIYTRAYLELQKWLKQNQLLNKVTYDFNHSHDSAALLMLKGKKSTTLMISSIYQSLPQALKDNYSAIPISPKSGAYLHVRPNLPEPFLIKIKESASHLNFQTWHFAIPPFNEPFQDELIDQINKFRPKAIN